MNISTRHSKIASSERGKEKKKQQQQRCDAWWGSTKAIAYIVWNTFNKRKSVSTMETRKTTLSLSWWITLNWMCMCECVYARINGSHTNCNFFLLYFAPYIFGFANVILLLFLPSLCVWKEERGDSTQFLCTIFILRNFVLFAVCCKHCYSILFIYS